jgi:transposase InsO family protein
MMFPLVRELAVDGIAVTVTCRVLKLCRQQYYRWLDEPITERQLDEAYLANAIFDAHRDDPEFGYRFLADEVRLGDHPDVSDRAVWRICRDNSWWSAFGKPKRTKGYRPGAPSHDDLVRRNFTADAPNVLWLADITEHWTDEGKLYCCAIKDAFSNRIVGWSIDSRMKARLVVAAIEMAVARRGDVAGCILHSDRGSQFRARKVQRALARHGLVGSMGQVGSAGDNAAMESFFALLQRNVLNRRRRWDTRDDLRIEIATWIERTYHRRRRQVALGRLTPIEYEIIMTHQTAAAA